MKKVLNFLLLLSSFTGYLEWGKGNHQFLFQMEGEVFGKLFTDPMSVMHPFILIPMAGQLLLLFTLFQQQPGKRITYAAMACLALLMLLILLIGILERNLVMIASVTPFLVLSFFVIRQFRKEKTNVVQ